MSDSPATPDRAASGLVWVEAPELTALELAARENALTPGQAKALRTLAERACRVLRV